MKMELGYKSDSKVENHYCQLLLYIACYLIMYLKAVERDMVCERL